MSQGYIFDNLQSHCAEDQGCVSCLVVNNAPERVSNLIQWAIGNLTFVNFQHYRTNSSVRHGPAFSPAHTYTIIGLVALLLIISLAFVIHCALLSKRNRRQRQEWRTLAQVVLGPKFPPQQRQMEKIRTAILVKPLRSHQVFRH